MLTTYRYKVAGLNLENFLFNLAGSGISLRNVRKKSKYLTFESNSQNDKLIKECAKNLGLYAKIVATKGLGKWIKSLPYKIGTALGVAYSIFCVCYFTSFVNVVDYVIENDHKCTNGDKCIFKQENLQDIKTEIEKYVLVGQRFNNDIQYIQNQITSKFELVENCIIAKNGNSVKIVLHEAVAKNVDKPKQIIAPQNCIIKSIDTYSGKALVKAGDVVTKGQILVDSDGDVLPQASIVAKVWYVGTAIHNCNQSMLVETGKTFTSSSIEVGELCILKHQQCNYQYFKEQISVTNISSTMAPIKKTNHTYFELELQSVFIPWESVKSTIIAQSKKDAISKTTGNVIDVTYSIVGQNNMYKVDCYMLCEEQIC